MKKYIKPELFYEHYELAQHIADCDWEMTSMDKNICVAYGDESTIYYEDGVSLFVTSIACDITDWEDYCYQNGVDGMMKVFAS